MFIYMYIMVYKSKGMLVDKKFFSEKIKKTNRRTVETCQNPKACAWMAKTLVAGSRLYVCMCVCMYACMCVYMYVCTYTCSHTYIYALYILHMLLLLTHTSVHGINNTQRMSARHPLFHRLLRQAMLFR